MKKQVSHLTYHERLKARQQHIDKILHFLSEEMYSIEHILRAVLELTRSPTSRILNSMLERGYLRKDSIKFLTSTSILWTITPNGLAEAGGGAILKTLPNTKRLAHCTLKKHIERQEAGVFTKEKRGLK